MTTTIPTGRFVWFEYMGKDPKKAQGFFGELFGWTAKDVPMPQGAYTMIAAPNGKTIGGYVPHGGDKAFWMSHLQVASAAETGKQIEKLGGKIEKAPFKVGDVGTMAIVSDPHGAAFALWQPVKPEEAPKPETGMFCWNELASKDPAASVKFYSAIAGFSDKAMDMGGHGTYHVLEKDGDSRAGVMGQSMPGQPHAWLAYVSVANADQTTDKAKRLGATVLVPPTDIPNVGRFSIFLDPQGAALGILQPSK